MTYIKKILLSLMMIIMTFISAIPVYAAYSKAGVAALSYSDFRPSSSNETILGYSKIGSFGLDSSTGTDGTVWATKWFETVTVVNGSYNNSTDSQTLTLRLYLTNRSTSDSRGSYYTDPIYLYINDKLVETRDKNNCAYIQPGKNSTTHTKQTINTTNCIATFTVTLKAEGTYTIKIAEPESGLPWTSAVSVYTTRTVTYPTYTVKFVDGLGNTLKEQNVKKYSSASAPSNPSRTGYTFAGWNGSYTNVTSNRTITATWNVNYYTLDVNGLLDGSNSGNTSGYGTFDVYVNGSLKANDVSDFCQSIAYGSSYQITDIKATTGHTYNGVNSGSVSGTIGTSGASVRLSFSTNKYTFDLNSMLDGAQKYGLDSWGTADIYINGSCVANDVTDHYASYYYGSTWEVKDIKAKNGYTYIGASSYSGTITGDTGANPTFVTNRVNIAYHPNGGTVGNGYTANQYGYVQNGYSDPWFHGIYYGNSDDPYNASSFGMSKRGYTFTGWRNDYSGKVYDQDTKYNANDYVGIDGSLVSTAGNRQVHCYVTAQWSPNHYKLTINPNGGTFTDGVTSSKTLSPDLIYDSSNWWNIGGVLPSRTGYVLTGFYTSSSGGSKIYNADGTATKEGTYFNSSNIYVNPGNLTVYAQYTPITYTNTINYVLTGLANQEGNASSNSRYDMSNSEESFNVVFTDAYGGGPTTFTMDSSRILNQFTSNPSAFGMQLTSTFTTADINGTVTSAGASADYSMPQTVTQKAYNMNFTYYYAPITYTITYNLNDGDGTPISRATNSGDNPSTYNVYYGFTLKEPTRTGYKFTGWVDESGNPVKAINEGANMNFIKSASKTGTEVKAMLSKRTARDITLTATWTPTNPELAVRKTTYYQDENITPDILKKNATAVDILEGDISDKIVIKSIEYDDGTVVTDPAYLDTSKEQTAKITYYVENQRGGSIEKSQTVTVIPSSKGHWEDGTDPVNPGANGQAVAGEDYDGSRIFSRYIREDCIYTLPGNSIWKTDTEYNDLLDSMTKGSEDYLTQYDSLLND